MAEPNPITTALIAAIMHSTEPMVLSDPNQPDHPLVAVNAAFERISLYAADQIIGRNCRFLQGSGTDRQTSARIRSCIAQRQGCVEWILNYRRDGAMFWNLLFLSPVFARDGSLLHYFGNQRDITEGPPSNLPDYTLGRAKLSQDGEQEFHALLLAAMEAGEASGADGPAAARTLERLVETARRLDHLTVRLSPAVWSPSGAP
jgi:PAS domain S-box-containing protein